LKSFDNSGIVAGTCWGAASLTLENAAFMLDNDYDNISMFFIPGSLPHMAAVETAIRYGIFGPSLTISNACATGSSVIVEAYRYIKDGLADVMVAGASEAPINKLALIALDKLHILSRIENPVEASRPFDKDRDGYVLSEGAATLILEELGHAIKRNAKIYGEIIGYSTNTDGLSVIKGSVASKARCISDALKYARVLPEEVDYINANGTSTIDNDIVETKALKSALGSHAYNIPISSTKA
jgi:3-oxoacyl-[acyl-carrier-protein] synthase II